MRHGESLANVAKIIISSPENGVKADYALSDTGRDQAKAAAVKSELGPDTLIFSSDFSRAHETAQIVADVIGAAAPQILTALRERNFGDLEHGPNSHYDAVWVYDSDNAAHTEFNVESVHAVSNRATTAILKLEKLYQGRTILLVSHGDTLQILQTAFERVDPHRHRSLRHLQTAEIRRLTLHQYPTTT